MSNRSMGLHLLTGMATCSENEPKALLPIAEHCLAPKPLPSYREMLGTRPQKSYIRPDKREAKAMTVVVGLQCEEGIVICSDQQVTSPGLPPVARVTNGIWSSRYRATEFVTLPLTLEQCTVVR